MKLREVRPWGFFSVAGCPGNPAGHLHLDKPTSGCL
jgi:hypothetical protein